MIETAIALAPLATPFVPVLIDTFVKPRLAKLAKTITRVEAGSIMSLSAYFSEYLERSYNRYYHIPILVFQNKQRKLNDIYLPLTVAKAGSDEGYVIDDFHDDFVPHFKKVLVRDTAGMGKSTLMKKLFLSCMENGSGVPIFVELRKLSSTQSLLQFVINELQAIDKPIDEEIILALLKSGGFVFFLDGYDEIPQAERNTVTKDLHDFISKTGKNLFIMTSRPENSLSSFASFMEFDIERLTVKEAFTLIRKYDEDGSVAPEIIKKLTGKTLEAVKDFLKNPLLVSLLYKAYDYKPTIPLKKNIFYRQVFDALFESHDLTKEGSYIREKACNLDSDSFHNVLRAFGYLTLPHGIEYTKDEVLAYLKEAKKRCATISFSESQFLEDMIKTVPIFSVEGGKYLWSHKSLQDYFAAQFIWLDSNEEKPTILRAMIQSNTNDKYRNVLDLYYDMDYRTFRRIVILDFVTDALKHAEITKAIKVPDKISGHELQIAKAISFSQPTVFTDVVPSITDFSGIRKLLQAHDINDVSYNAIHMHGFGKKGVFLTFPTCHAFVAELLADKKEPLFLERPTLPKSYQHKGFIGLTATEFLNSGLSSTSQFLKHALFLTRGKAVNFDKCNKLRADIEREIRTDDSTSLVDGL